MRKRMAAGVATAVLAAVAGAGVPTAAQDPPPPTPVPSMAFVGDSVATQSVEEVVATVAPTRPISHLLVANGSTIPWSRRQVVEAVVGEDAPSILVVVLGHADLGWGWGPQRLENNLRGFLDAVTPHVDCIRWFDVKPRDTRFVEVNARGAAWNRQLRTVVRDYPNVEVFPYSRWATTVNRPWFTRDLLHLSPPGEWELGRMVRQAADGCDPGLSTGPFWDVRDDHWAAGAVAWAHEQGLVAGYPGGTYQAQLGRLRLPASRVQLASLLWRRAGSPRATHRAGWSDVRPGQRAAVDWVSEQGLVNGYPDGTFRPHDPLTRGVLARALWRAAGSPPASPATWPDVPARLATAVAWATSTDAVPPYADGTFRPRAAANRWDLANASAPPEVRGPRQAPPPPVESPSAPAPTPLDVPGDPIFSAPGG